MRWALLVVCLLVLFTAAGSATSTHVCGSGLLQLLCDSNGNLMVNSGSGASAVTANQGTPASPSGAWPIQLVDSGGVNVASVNASGQLAVVATQGTSPWVVTTPAPVATVTALQGTSPWVVTTPAPVGTLGVVVQSGCVAAYPCGMPTPIPFPTVGAVLQAACAAAYPCGFPTPNPTQAARIVGNAGGVVDAVNKTGAPPANILAHGCEVTAQGGNDTSATTADSRICDADLSGDIHVIPGSSNVWSCTLHALVATLTQCQAAPAAGFRAYITDITVDTTTATAGTYDVTMGTGTNCGTTNVALYPGDATTSNWTAPVLGAPEHINFTTPLAPAAADEICVTGTATNTINIQLQGYVAP